LIRLALAKQKVRQIQQVPEKEKILARGSQCDPGEL
jgi:hypothetical protein